MRHKAFTMNKFRKDWLSSQNPPSLTIGRCEDEHEIKGVIF